MAGLLARLLRLLERPRALAAIAALAAALALPTLAIGFYADDYAELATLERAVPQLEGVSPIDLYRFVPADRRVLAELVQRGPLPWFTDPGLKVHFFRPLSGAMVFAEHALFGRFAAGYHLTTVLVYAALCLAVGLLYRAILGPRGAPAPLTATLAALCFAVAPCHAQPVAWIAGRHMLVSALPSALALAAHVRHARDGWRPGAWLAPLGIVLALLAGESGLGAVAYWLAFDALGPAHASRSARIRSALPALAIAAVYALAYKAMGYGAAHSGAYLDPAADPAAFAAALTTRLPALALEAFTGFPSDLLAVGYPALFVIGGVATVAAVAALVRATLPAIPDDERAALRWLLPGAIGSAVLAAGGFTGGRLLLFPSVGVAFLAAVLLRRGVGVTGRAFAMGRAWLVAVHLALGPFAIVLGALATADVAHRGLEVYRTAELGGPPPYRVVVVAASDPMVAFYPAVMGVALSPENAGTWQVLSTAKHAHRVTRTGPRRLRLDVIGGREMEGAFDKNFRSLKRPFHVGDRVELIGAAVTVLSLADGLPSAFEVELDVPVDDPSLNLLTWQGGRLARFHPPPVGESVVLPWSPGPFRLF
jgi:hypothetical protein